MNLLLYSSVFAPSVGGIETISQTLAENLTKCGVNVHVVTETPEDQNVLEYSFRVTRNPGPSDRFKIVKSSDLVFSNGASLALFFHAKLAGKPFVWTHNGYQLMCIDGLGWVDGQPSPLSPLPSIWFHLKRKGLYYAAKAGAKLYLRRLVANIVDLNIAATRWVAKRQPLRNQVVLHTPYALSKFRALPNPHCHQFDFIFVGRLVSEKGVGTLLKAFRLLIDQGTHRNNRLLIVGDGQWRPKLETYCTELKLTQQVFFAGKQVGEALLEHMSKAPIAIVPSEWEEPMGGVALEHLAAGKNVIISASGGMAECIGEAGLIFANGDAQQLCNCMKDLSENATLRRHQHEMARAQLEKFDDMILTRRYLEVFETIVSSRKQSGTTH